SEFLCALPGRFFVPFSQLLIYILIGICVGLQIIYWFCLPCRRIFVILRLIGFCLLWFFRLVKHGRKVLQRTHPFLFLLPHGFLFIGIAFIPDYPFIFGYG